MAKGMSTAKIIGLLLLIAGVIVLGIGIYKFIDIRQQLGSFAGGLNKLSKAVGGKGIYQQPIIMMVCGAAGAVVGCFIYKKS
jgi:hypothetical protein